MKGDLSKVKDPHMRSELRDMRRAIKDQVYTLRIYKDGEFHDLHTKDELHRKLAKVWQDIYDRETD